MLHLEHRGIGPGVRAQESSSVAQRQCLQDLLVDSLNDGEREEMHSLGLPECKNGLGRTGVPIDDVNFRFAPRLLPDERLMAKAVPRGERDHD
jgi:hypothetical protein